MRNKGEHGSLLPPPKKTRITPAWYFRHRKTSYLFLLDKMWPYVQFAVFISMMVTLTTFFCSVGTRAKRRRKKKRAKRRKRRRKKRRKGKEETHPHRTPMTTERGWYIWNVLQLPEIWQITSTIKYTNYFYHSFVFFYWILLFLDRI